MSDKESDDEMLDADPTTASAAMSNGAADPPVSGPDSIAAGVAAGNIHLQSANAATLALPEASRPSCVYCKHTNTMCTRSYLLIASIALQGSKEAREQQERLLQAVEERRALRETAVPTSDAEVRAALRAIREPVTLFGEQQVHLFCFSLGQASADA